MRLRREPLTAVLLAVLVSGCAEPAETADPPVEQAWAWEMPECVAYQPAAYEAPERRRSAEVREEQGFTKHIERYEAGWGSRAVEEIREVVRDCARYEYGEDRDESFLEQHRVVETGFGGDESLLVETAHLAPPTNQTWYAAVVRRGDEVITVRSSTLGGSEVRCLAGADDATCV